MKKILAILILSVVGLQAKAQIDIAIEPLGGYEYPLLDIDTFNAADYVNLGVGVSFSCGCKGTLGLDIITQTATIVNSDSFFYSFFTTFNPETNQNEADSSLLFSNYKGSSIDFRLRYDYYAWQPYYGPHFGVSAQFNLGLNEPQPSAIGIGGQAGYSFLLDRKGTVFLNPRVGVLYNLYIGDGADLLENYLAPYVNVRLGFIIGK